MQKSYSFWKNLIIQKGLQGLDIKEVQKIHDEKFIKNEYEKFEMLYQRFIKFVATHHVKNLQKMKIVREDIVNMMSGIMPENAVLIFKVLPEYGGEANENNIMFMPLHPYNDGLIDFYHQQMADNKFEFPDVFYAIQYPDVVFYPNLFLKNIAGKAMPERIEVER